MPLAASPLLRLAATVFSALFIGFGINAMLRPAHGLSFFEPFEHSYPPSASEASANAEANAELRKLIDALMVVYGVRDVFLGVAVLVPLWLGSRKVAGALLVAGSAVAGVDGAVCRAAGGGEWAHWGYAPVVAVVGVALMV